MNFVILCTESFKTSFHALVIKLNDFFIENNFYKMKTNDSQKAFR